jgi:large repetitive protein
MNRRAIIVATLVLGALFAVTAPPALAQGTADLSIAKSADTTKVALGQDVTYTITVTNLGPDVATGVVFGDEVPDLLNLVSFSCSEGTVVNTFCQVDSLSSGATVTAALVGTPISVCKRSVNRMITDTSTVVASTADPDSSDNTASVSVRFIGKPNAEEHCHNAG